MKKKSKQNRRERLELLPSEPDDPQPIHDLPKLPGLQQLRVLNLLYSEGPLSVRQVQQSKKLKIQDRRYSTILSLLRRMHETGWLTREPWGAAFRYRPAMTEAKMQRNFLEAVLKYAFQGSVTKLQSTLTVIKKECKAKTSKLA